MEDATAFLTEEALKAAGLILSALLSWVLIVIKNRYNLDIKLKELDETKSLRDVLAEAMFNAARSAIAQKPDATDDELKDAVVNYVVRGIPDTLAKLGVGSRDYDILRSRAEGVLATVKALPRF